MSTGRRGEQGPASPGPSTGRWTVTFNIPDQLVGRIGVMIRDKSDGSVYVLGRDDEGNIAVRLYNQGEELGNRSGGTQAATQAFSNVRLVRPGTYVLGLHLRAMPDGGSELTAIAGPSPASPADVITEIPTGWKWARNAHRAVDSVGMIYQSLPGPPQPISTPLGKAVVVSAAYEPDK